MTDQPTDHRAQAADYLKQAANMRDAEQRTALALIGIGHALLALAPTVTSNEARGAGQQ